MPKENIAGFSLRLNLDNEQHIRIYKVLHELNVDIHKSKNQFMVEALDFYIRSFEEDDLLKNAMIAKANKQGWVSKSDFEEFKTEMKVEVRNELIQLLGGMIAGKNINDVHAISSVSAVSQHVGSDFGVAEEVSGMTNQDAINLISSWG
jgi:hypothetical protein